MSNEGSADHFAAVIADLKAQILRLEQAIEVIRAVQTGAQIPAAAQSSALPSNGGPGKTAEAIEIAMDEFHQMTVGAAIRKYLGMRGRKPATTAEVIQALTKGGQSGSEGSNYNVVVNNTLNRLQAADGGISRVRRGVWGLREWYENKGKSED